jgi:hypothetical protein
MNEQTFTFPSSSGSGMYTPGRERREAVVQLQRLDDAARTNA